MQSDKGKTEKVDKVEKEDKECKSGAMERMFCAPWWGQRKPRRIMTLAESREMYPNVPHSWLCDGKLLRLLDPTCPHNLTLFKVK